MFSPFHAQFEAVLIKDEGTFVLLNLKNGSVSETISFPKSLLPKEIAPGESFVLKLMPTEAAKEGELVVLQKLLQNLIQ